MVEMAVNEQTVVDAAGWVPEALSAHASHNSSKGA
jgi:hypothetical protein